MSVLRIRRNNYYKYAETSKKKLFVGGRDLKHFN